MPCTEHISSTCDAGHKQSWKCSDKRPKSCSKCEREAKLAKEKQKREIEEHKRQEIEEREHLARMDDINARIAKELQAREQARLEQQRSQAIKQKEDDLTALKASPTLPTVPAPPAPEEASTLSKLQQMLASPSKILATASSMLSRSAVDASPDSSSGVKAKMTSQMPSSSAPPKLFPKLAESPSKKEWLRQKNIDGAKNHSIDAIMDMTGLEEVKKKVLNIKTKIDISLRQSASLKQERFNAVLLGNPGTGGCSIFHI